MRVRKSECTVEESLHLRQLSQVKMETVPKKCSYLLNSESRSVKRDSCVSE